jgi:micrococcal nuclease
MLGSGIANKTINIRLAGIDCPEGAYFGKPGQPFHDEAKAYLTSLVENRSVHFRLFRLDQYNRAVRLAIRQSHM